MLVLMLDFREFMCTPGPSLERGEGRNVWSAVVSVYLISRLGEET